jgi:hypothetical protein
MLDAGDVLAQQQRTGTARDKDARVPGFHTVV